ncbi:MAG: YdcF family protein [Bacteriovoracaceae bacterium]
MFKSKYVFETRATRYKRQFSILLLMVFLCFIAYLVASGVLIYFSKQISSSSEKQLFQKQPDLIVAFTGHSGRIPYTVELSQKFKQPKIFISGVYSKNTVATLVSNYKIKGLLDPDLVEIDYSARNTIENVLSTYSYLERNKGINDVLIISHDYHLARIKLTVESMKPSNVETNFYYMGLEADYLVPRNIKILLKEVYKFIRGFIFLILWDY